jgi:hypothetical protein
MNETAASFTSANSIVKPVHSKGMPVLLLTAVSHVSTSASGRCVRRAAGEMKAA